MDPQVSGIDRVHKRRGLDVRHPLQEVRADRHGDRHGDNHQHNRHQHEPNKRPPAPRAHPRRPANELIPAPHRRARPPPQQAHRAGEDDKVRARAPRAVVARARRKRARREPPLQRRVVRAARRPRDAHRTHCVLQHRLHELRDQVDVRLDREHDARVPRRRVGPHDQEQVGKRRHRRP